MGQELSKTYFKDNKIYFGEKELTNLCWTLIRIYRFKFGNRDPIVIILPDIKEIGGVKIEFPKEIRTRQEPDKLSNTDS